MRRFTLTVSWLVAAWLGFYISIVVLVRVNLLNQDAVSQVCYVCDIPSKLEENRALLDSPNAADLRLIVANSNAVLKRSPLEDEAYVQIALALKQRDENPAAQETLMLKAQRLNGRNRRAAGALLEMYARLGDVHRTVQQIDLLYRLEPEIGENLIAALSAIYVLDDGKRAIDSALVSEPSWAGKFLLGQMQLAEDADSLLSLEVPIRDMRAGVIKNRMVRNLSEKLISKGEYDKAFELWQSSFGDGPGVLVSQGNLIRNPHFSDWSTPPPFNWKLFRHPNAAADRFSAGGLSATVSGGRPRLIARQYFFSRGSAPFRIDSAMRHNASRNRGYFEWRIVCRPSGEQLYAIAVDENLFSPDTNTWRFSSIDEECRLMEVQLWAIPGFYAKRTRLTVDSFSITKTQTK